MVGQDILIGGWGNDVFVISAATEGNLDTINGSGGMDILQLSSGTHSFNNDAKLFNLEQINTHILVAM